MTSSIAIETLYKLILGPVLSLLKVKLFMTFTLYIHFTSHNSSMADLAIPRI